jgi:hypothetical protein
MFTIDFKYDGRLEGLDEEIKAAVAVKLNQLTDVLYSKVIENLSGKVLQKRTGALLDSIRREVDVGDNPMIGTVFPEPADAKAWALELGGEREYAILPTKASVLAFFWEKEGRQVFLPSVNHPPSRAFRYLGIALDEMEALVPEGFREALDEVLSR